MSSVVATNGQTRWKNSYDSSSEAKLTLRVNGEEKGVVITPQGAIVRAGFDAPTVVPSLSLAGAGNVPEGFYFYRYVYASSRYPFVANAVTGDGDEWPRSNPSDGDNIQVTGGAQQVSVQVTYTTRSDVDSIWIYRTEALTTAEAAEAANDAGQLFYVGRIANNSAGGTGIFADNEAANTGEILELDNFLCPLFRYTKFDGFYWWGFGNTTLTAVVTLDGTSTFSIDTAQSDVDEWFDGRDGYTINFVGITTGGYDGRGNYYFKAVTATTGQAFAGSDLVTPTTIAATGTTTAYLTAPSTTLYRSKELNPFSWGRTTQLADGVSVSDLWAERIGGGIGTGLSLIPNERILKLDTEGPQKSYALDLNAADNSDFMGTLRTLDEAQSTSSNFSQFPMRLTSGQTVQTSVNAKAFQLLSADGQSQIPIGDNVKLTLDAMLNDHPAPDFYHGVYDYRTELNCWFIKTTEADLKCDTLIYQHAPTGQWGMRYYPGISASCTIFDEVTRDHYTFVGDEWGKLGILFDAGRYSDWVEGCNASFNPAFPIIDLPIYGSTINATIASGGTITLFITELTPGHIEEGALLFFHLEDGMLNGNYIVQSFNSGTGEIQINGEGEWTSSSSGVVAHPYNRGVNVTVTENSGTARRHMYYEMEGEFFSVSLSPPATLSVNCNENASFINLDTGELGDIVSPFSDCVGAIGANPCFVSRWWDMSAPSKNKLRKGTWATEQNVDSDALTRHRWTYYNEYQDTESVTSSGMISPSRDVIGIGATPSDVYFATSVPSTISKAFGMDFMEVGFGQYRMLNFNVEVQPS